MESLIGKVPYDWAQTLLGEVCHIVAEPSGGSLRHGIGVPRGIPMITPKDLNGNRLVYDGIALVEPATAAKLSRYLDLPAGGGHQGYAAMVDGSGSMVACWCSHSIGGR